jgi:transcriptional regulator with XRE-family HTH domain
MSAGQAFGPDLRRARVKRGIALEEISFRTKVSVDLWAALERNDFARWPTGIYARAYVREYARAIGVDPGSTVEEFCRLFPQGDRRSERVLREQAAIVGHELVWSDDPLPAAGDDRRARREPAVVRWSMDSPRMRCIAAGIDLGIVSMVGAIGAAFGLHDKWIMLAVVTLLYYSVNAVVLGRTLGALAVGTYLSARAPQRRKSDAPSFDGSLTGVLATDSGGRQERQK